MGIPGQRDPGGQIYRNQRMPRNELPPRELQREVSREGPRDGPRRELKRDPSMEPERNPQIDVYVQQKRFPIEVGYFENILVNLKDSGTFSKCPQIYIKLRGFEENDSGKLPFKYCQLRLCSF